MLFLLLSILWSNAATPDRHAANISFDEPAACRSGRLQFDKTTGARHVVEGAAKVSIVARGAAARQPARVNIQ
jgi:hypothetical protein